MYPRDARGGHRAAEDLTHQSRRRLVPGNGVRLTALVRPNRVLFACAAALAWCSTGTGLALPWTVSEVLTSLVRGKPVAGPVVLSTVVTLAAFESQAACGRLLAAPGGNW
ncbi:hypothetical protein [Streptomyces sp. Wb2n-11]|uniref:hypothetical protein n=1 Tax=Streptomyces sp. Wb2n-11 TaxID=1030533 RepID=UPI001146932C|nr:hypothetical protein [Streptomyces sp. Wb2n-11]